MQYPNRPVTASELQVGDVVTHERERISPFDACIVSRVDEKMAYLWRPYGTTASEDVYGGEKGQYTITLIGTEEYPVYRDSDRTYYVWSRYGQKPK
jgi:hypothetical protein